MKRFLALIFSLIFIASLSLPSFAIDNPPEVEKCQSAYLYSFANNRVLYEYNPEKRVYPTSTVKIMTGLLALDAVYCLQTQWEKPVRVCGSARHRGHRH